jgi:hypothetical protein
MALDGGRALAVTQPLDIMQQAEPCWCLHSQTAGPSTWCCVRGKPSKMNPCSPFSLLPTSNLLCSSCRAWPNMESELCVLGAVMLCGGKQGTHVKDHVIWDKLP